MLAALVPVKGLEDAKTRLSARLDPAQRAGLCLAMMTDVLATLMRSPEVGMVLVVSPDPRVLAEAAAQGAGTVSDRACTLNGAVSLALATAARLGATRALVLPGDVPMVTPKDVAHLVASLPAGDGVVVSPTWDWGTGALLLQPPCAIDPAYGPRSCERHLAGARRAGLPALVRLLPNLAADLDRPADLARYVSQNHSTRTAEFLAAIRPFWQEGLKCM